MLAAVLLGMVPRQRVTEHSQVVYAVVVDRAVRVLHSQKHLHQTLLHRLEACTRSLQAQIPNSRMVTQVDQAMWAIK